MQCSPQCVLAKSVMHKKGHARQHIRTTGAWRGLDRQALEGCLGVVALALGVVMAGTGHLPTLKLLRGGSSFLNTSSLPLLTPIIPSPPPFFPLNPPLNPPTPPPPYLIPQIAFPFFVMHSAPRFVEAILFLTLFLCSCFQLLLTPIFLPHVSCLQDPCDLFPLASIQLALDPIHLHCISSAYVNIALSVDSPDES